jgi:hypothetical protein
VKYRVYARWWGDENIRARFGMEGSVHDLTGDEVVEAIQKLGRASITKTDEDMLAPWMLKFENDYD